eukprot:2949089-Rhodomonas_salina.1
MYSQTRSASEEGRVLTLRLERPLLVQRGVQTQFHLAAQPVAQEKDALQRRTLPQHPHQRLSPGVSHLGPPKSELREPRELGQDRRDACDPCFLQRVRSQVEDAQGRGASQRLRQRFGAVSCYAVAAQLQDRERGAARNDAGEFSHAGVTDPVVVQAQGSQVGVRLQAGCKRCGCLVVDAILAEIQPSERAHASEGLRQTLGSLGPHFVVHETQILKAGAVFQRVGKVGCPNVAKGVVHQVKIGQRCALPQRRRSKQLFCADFFEDARSQVDSSQIGAIS